MQSDMEKEKAASVCTNHGSGKKVANRWEVILDRFFFIMGLPVLALGTPGKIKQAGVGADGVLMGEAWFPRRR